GVGGEEPVVPVEVAGTVLALAVDGLVKVFHDHGTGRPGSVVIGVDIGDEPVERLGAVAEFGGRLLAGVCGVEHDPGTTRVHRPALAAIPAKATALGAIAFAAL